MSATELDASIGAVETSPTKGHPRSPDLHRELDRVLRLVDALAATDPAALRRLRDLIDARMVEARPREGRGR